jgi:hypothetical protein
VLARLLGSPVGVVLSIKPAWGRETSMKFLRNFSPAGVRPCCVRSAVPRVSQPSTRHLVRETQCAEAPLCAIACRLGIAGDGASARVGGRNAVGAPR